VSEKIFDVKCLLEPDGAIKTRATYFIYTDTGGFIPSFLANRISMTGITKLFAAVRTQVKDPKYTVATPGGAVPTAGATTNGKNEQARITTDEKSKKPE
jgi:hypothetical protein